MTVTKPSCEDVVEVQASSFQAPGVTPKAATRSFGYLAVRVESSISTHRPYDLSDDHFWQSFSDDNNGKTEETAQNIRLTVLIPLCPCRVQLSDKRGFSRPGGGLRNIEAW
jgi:hypothetical protein